MTIKIMKLIFLGSGSAFTVGHDNYQSNMIFESDRGRKLLIDCGSDIRFSLNAVGLCHLDITDIYISHLHADHVGGLEYIGFTTKFDPRCNKPNLYASKELAHDLWYRTLSGGMRSIEGELASIDTFFEVHPICKGDSFIWEGVEFKLIRVIHVDNGYFMMPSYGLYFEVDGVKVLLSTDTQFKKNLNDLYKQADIIFHDCETSFFPSGIHAHYNELMTLPAHIRSKIWLYHYEPGTLPDAEKDGFRGFVKRGQTFELVREACRETQEAIAV